MDAILSAMPSINYTSTNHNSLRNLLRLLLIVLKMTIATSQILSYLAKVEEILIREKNESPRWSIHRPGIYVTPNRYCSSEGCKRGGRTMPVDKSVSFTWSRIETIFQSPVRPPQQILRWLEDLDQLDLSSYTVGLTCLPPS
jgi:hypothetical protein